MADHHDVENKIKRLQESGVFNRSHVRVQDQLFIEHEFFCPYDLIQVKYEMVRRVANDDWTVSRAAETYGFSRVSFYESQKAIEREGLAGLIPRKRGPKTAHKLTDEVMEPDRRSSCDAAFLRSSYELLRRDALDNVRTGCMKGKGLVLVLRYGMFAWLQEWSECEVAVTETKKSSEETGMYMMPEEIRYQTAVLLATMALHVRREVRSI